MAPSRAVRAGEALRGALRVSGDVRAGEGREVGLLLSNLFLLLVAWYLLKTVREPMILVGGGAELKSYASAAQAVVLVAWVPAYGWLAARVPRLLLVRVLTLFFVGSIQVFFVLARLEVPWLGFAFFVWVGIFSLSVVAQFWSFANDLYAHCDGERLFPVIAVGAAVGAPVGSAIAGWLFGRGAPIELLMQIAAALLLVSLALYGAIDRGRRGSVGCSEAPGAGLGLGFIAREPYLRLIALFLILLNLVNTTGEYVMSKQVLAAAAAASVDEDALAAWIGAFYGSFFSIVNLGAIGLQVLVVSRLVRYGGLAAVLLALPLVSLGTYALVGAGAGLALLRVAKSAENATDYSITNTARAMLWLPASRAEKYEAKQSVDTLFVRVGDVLAAAFVFAGTTWMGLTPRGFGALNLLVVAAWMGVALMLLGAWRHRASVR